jgi:hypothetical protein
MPVLGRLNVIKRLIGWFCRRLLCGNALSAIGGEGKFAALF